jgi:hypothetical protein
MKRLTLSILGFAIGALSGCGTDSEFPTLVPALLPTEVDSTKQANFVNGDFEDGTLNGWTVQTFARPPIPVYPPTKVVGSRPDGRRRQPNDPADRRAA